MSKVLAADDAAFTRMMPKSILTEGGFEIVREAESGAEAVELYNELRPDLTRTAVTMPKMDGFAALKTSRSLDTAACVVMRSATGRQSTVAESMHAGARDLLLKPFQPERAIEAIEKALA